MFSVPVSTQAVRLAVGEPATTYRVNVGHLDPVEERSGARRRLEHLGYLSAGPLVGDDTERLRLAVEAFQRANGLPATGALDEVTERALTRAHGT